MSECSRSQRPIDDRTRLRTTHSTPPPRIHHRASHKRRYPFHDAHSTPISSHIVIHRGSRSSSDHDRPTRGHCPSRTRLSASRRRIQRLISVHNSRDIDAAPSQPRNHDIHHILRAPTEHSRQPDHRAATCDHPRPSLSDQCPTVSPPRGLHPRRVAHPERPRRCLDQLPHHRHSSLIGSPEAAEQEWPVVPPRRRRHGPILRHLRLTIEVQRIDPHPTPQHRVR